MLKKLDDILEKSIAGITKNGITKNVYNLIEEINEYEQYELIQSI